MLNVYNFNNYIGIVASIVIVRLIATYNRAGTQLVGRPMGVIFSKSRHQRYNAAPSPQRCLKLVGI